MDFRKEEGLLDHSRDSIMQEPSSLDDEKSITCARMNRYQAGAQEMMGFKKMRDAGVNDRGGRLSCGNRKRTNIASHPCASPLSAARFNIIATPWTEDTHVQCFLSASSVSLNFPSKAKKSGNIRCDRDFADCLECNAKVVICPEIKPSW